MEVKAAGRGSGGWSFRKAVLEHAVAPATALRMCVWGPVPPITRRRLWLNGGQVNRQHASTPGRVVTDARYR
jgi:hypothetical protein